MQRPAKPWTPVRFRPPPQVLSRRSVRPSDDVGQRVHQHTPSDTPAQRAVVATKRVAWRSRNQSDIRLPQSFGVRPPVSNKQRRPTLDEVRKRFRAKSEGGKNSVHRNEHGARADRRVVRSLSGDCAAGDRAQQNPEDNVERGRSVQEASITQSSDSHEEHVCIDRTCRHLGEAELLRLQGKPHYIPKRVEKFRCPSRSSFSVTANVITAKVV